MSSTAQPAQPLFGFGPSLRSDGTEFHLWAPAKREIWGEVRPFLPPFSTIAWIEH
jgi:hypothetical protein